jgi:hypothetical protein
MIKYSLIALLFSLLSGIYTPVLAEDNESESDSGSFFIPKAQRRFSEEQPCVEPIEEMRTNHMEYILDQRDETVHEGIRTKQHSLDECINCHVSDAADAPHIDSEKHFCNSCHTYASVSIDCFQCHADRPVKTHFHSLTISGKHHIKTGLVPPTTLSSEQLKVLSNEDFGNE